MRILRVIVPILLTAAACGAPAQRVADQPIVKTGTFKRSPSELATCFLSAYQGKYVETYSFERAKEGDRILVSALRYGGQNDLILDARYYWTMEFRPAPGGSAVTLRSLPDQVGIDRAKPDIWPTLSACE